MCCVCRECVLIRHPRVGEYAFGFITGQTFVETDNGEIQLYSVYVPTNHGTINSVFNGLTLSKYD